MRENVLAKILDHKRQEVAAARKKLPFKELQAQLRKVPPPQDFAAALGGRGYIALIAEVKFKSPSQGIIQHGFSLAEVVQCYREAGAEAISILTDKRFFGGSPNFLAEARRLTNQSLLRKDFIVDIYQLYESRLLGADAVLLLARILPPPLLGQFIDVARQLGMESLVECCTAKEIEGALAAGATLIGINNRDLATFQVDLQNTFKLVGEVNNPDIILVSESGIRNRMDVEILATYGIDAILVGGALMSSPNIQRAAASLRGVPSSRRVASL